MIVGRHLGIAGRFGPLDLELAPGTRIALVGPNGSGKTSLLRALAGIDGTGGEMRIEGENLRAAPQARRPKLLGYLPSSRDLPWTVPVRDVIRLGVGAVDGARPSRLVEALELDHLLGRAVTALSTGERTRVLLARTLMAAPKLLLLDEPLANLDPYWVLRFLGLFDAEAKRGAVVVAALHDLHRLNRFDRALLLDHGQIVNDETPDLLLAGPAFENVFRVTPEAALIRPSADPRSSR